MTAPDPHTDAPPASPRARECHLLKPRTWPIGLILGIDTKLSQESGQDRTLGDLIDQAGRTRAWSVATGLVWRSGLPGLLFLALALLAAITVGDRAYRNLQLHYQTEMLRAVAGADVIHNICRQRSDILWKDCATPSSRGAMSDRFVWAMLVSADVIDPLSIALPTQLEERLRADPGASVVTGWLRDEDRARRTGVDLLIAASHVCSRGIGTKAEPLKAIIAAALADIYEPLPGEEDWLRSEVFRAFGTTVPDWLPPLSDGIGAANAWLSATWNQRILRLDPAPAQRTWPVPADLRIALGASGNTYLLNEPGVRNDPDGGDHERGPRGKAWVAMSSSSAGETGTTDDIRTFLGSSIDRRAVPDHLDDADIVATLFALGELIDRDTASFRQRDFASCDLEDVAGLGRDQQEAVIANLEKLALYVAGQIRNSPEVKRARFWVSVYTGHEQRLLLIIAAFGAIVVLSRIVVFAVLNLRAVVSGWRAALVPWERGPVIPTQRDNDFDRLASSRWPIRIAVALLPAIGFIGTVRGIMLSLSGADAIVWAETVNQRSAAISALTADLGLAFATTLLALVFGALLTVLVAVEMALGERLLLRRYDHPKGRRARSG